MPQKRSSIYAEWRRLKRKIRQSNANSVRRFARMVICQQPWPHLNVRSRLILKCAKPVGELIRKRFAASKSLQMVGNALADAWAWFAVFVVMALWFICGGHCYH